MGFKNIEFIPQYQQSEAPSIYQRADLLVHLKHMDWTPNVVAEAMACGLPIVHMGNGGVPEIVKEAGVSLEVATDWERIQIPAPESVASGVVTAYRDKEWRSKKAREIAVKEYSMRDWVSRHQTIFNKLIH